MRFKLLYITVFVLAANVCRAQQADTVFNLQQCLDIAIKNNLDVKKSENDMERERIYWQQSRQNLLPTINGSVGHTIYNGRSQNADLSYVTQQITNADYNLSSNLVIFRGGALINSIKQYSLAYKAGQLDFQQAKNQITLNVITAYLLVQNNEDQVIQAETQVDVSKKQVERLDILNKEGNVSPTEFYNLKGQLANDQLSLITAKNSLTAAKLDLLQIMNVPYSRNTKFERLPVEQLPGAYTQSEADIYNAAINDLPVVQSLDLRVKSAEKAVRASKGYLYPSLSLNGGVSTLYSSGSRGSYFTQFRGNYSTGFGVVLNIPILNFFQARNNVKLAKLNLRDAQNNSNTTRVQLKQNIELAYANMGTSYERYKTLSDQVDAYAEAFRTAEVKFNSGALNSVDFVIAKGNLDRSRTNFIVARYDYFIRTKILDYYQNKLSF